MTETTTEIPVWVAGRQLWISGVSRRTTVNDVVETLLGRPDKQYSIMEKWRRMERPLNADTRILKLWKTWGDVKTEVKLSLKKIPMTEKDSGRNSPVSVSGTHRKQRHKSTCSKYGQAVHPRRLAQLSETQNIERLLKLIVVQGETIQNQILRLKERENQIELLEREQHENRINVLGTNYLLEAYLGDGGGVEEKEDSGVATEQLSSASTDYLKYEEITIKEDVESEIRDLQDRVHLLEQIAETNNKLEREEESLFRLFINIERCKKSDTVITKLRSSVEKLRRENALTEKEMKRNAKKLIEFENAVNNRKCYLKILQRNVLLKSDVVKTGPKLAGACSANKLLEMPISTIPYGLPLACSPSDDDTFERDDYYSLPNEQKPILGTLV